MAHSKVIVFNDDALKWVLLVRFWSAYNAILRYQYEVLGLQGCCFYEIVVRPNGVNGALGFSDGSVRRAHSNRSNLQTIEISVGPGAAPRPFGVETPKAMM